MKKINVYKSGIFTIREYALEQERDAASLVRLLQAGPGQVQEVIAYVFDGEDPLGIDTKSFSADTFIRLFPELGAYGSGLAFDVILQLDGSPVTVELTKGSGIVAINSLDAEIELGELLGKEEMDGTGRASAGPAAAAESAAEKESLAEKKSAAEKKSLAEKKSTAEKKSPVERKSAAETGLSADTDGMREEAAEELSPEKLLELLAVAERLKCHTRHCDTSSGRRESVAEHSWRLALMAMLVSGVKEYREFDMDRVIRMCLIHDLGEAFTGDIPTFEKTRADTAEEERRLAEWVDTFPGVLRREFRTLYEEMGERKTPEAQLYKALDKMEAVIQHNESDLSSWLPLEYDLQRTYGSAEVQFSAFLRSLKECVDAWTERKIAGNEALSNGL